MAPPRQRIDLSSQGARSISQHRVNGLADPVNSSLQPINRSLDRGHLGFQDGHACFHSWIMGATAPSRKARHRQGGFDRLNIHSCLRQSARDNVKLRWERIAHGLASNQRRTTAAKRNFVLPQFWQLIRKCTVILSVNIEVVVSLPAEIHDRVLTLSTPHCERLSQISHFVILHLPDKIAAFPVHVNPERGSHGRRIRHRGSCSLCECAQPDIKPEGAPSDDDDIRVSRRAKSSQTPSRPHGFDYC